tara:strand:- start:8214 stop:9263 length:1050 start_codon:yes stop_codon:yes gene_type:complete
MAILSDVKLADRIEVPTERKLTDSGQMHVPCAFARTGSQLYSAKQLGIQDEDPNKVITVWRDEADVFAEDSMSTFRSAPVTIGHPKDAEGKAIAVTAKNASDLQVGMLEGMPVRDEDTLSGMLILTDQAAIDVLEDGTQELSAGYLCDIEEVDGKYFQRNIRANHIAIVAKGRAGSSCRVADEEVVMVTDEDHQLVVDELAKANAELETQKQLVVDFKESADKAELAVESLKVELADAVTAASEGVIERCQTIEDARLIADMRDLGSKSIADIHRLVVEDQMPDKDFTGKSEAYISAMFEILVDSSKGETPMGKLLKQQETHVVVDAKPVQKVADARSRMIARQKAGSK